MRHQCGKRALCERGAVGRRAGRARPQGGAGEDTHGEHAGRKRGGQTPRGCPGAEEGRACPPAVWLPSGGTASLRTGTLAGAFGRRQWSPEGDEVKTRLAVSGAALQAVALVWGKYG